MPLALRARSLWKSYAAGVAGCSARIWVLRGANLDVHDGECVAIVGARGAGATTLLHCLAGVRRLDAGTVERRRPPLLLTNWDASSVQRASGDIVLVDDSMRTGATTLIPRIVRDPAEGGAAVIIATHALSSVRHCADRVLLLRDGHLDALPLHSGSRRVAERAITTASGACAEIEIARRASPEIEEPRRRPTTVNR